mgnify:CR=1 FL=1
MSEFNWNDLFQLPGYIGMSALLMLISMIIYFTIQYRKYLRNLNGTKVGKHTKEAAIRNMIVNSDTTLISLLCIVWPVGLCVALIIGVGTALFLTVEGIIKLLTKVLPG